MGQHDSPYTLVTSREIFRNAWIRVSEDAVVAPGGAEKTMGMIDIREGSTVLALDRDDVALLVGEYKYGIDSYSIELVSGGMDAGETPLDCAKRELREELGVVAESWTHLGCVDPFTTVVRARNHMFLAAELHHVGAAPDEGEVLEEIRVPFGDAVAMALQGEISHAASALCLLKARLLRAGG